jgi:protein-S-isoprenylcysteine O-methyltransferase Ste14
MVKRFLSYLLNNKTFIFLFLTFFLFSQNVYSHGLNVRYELPIPIYLYLIFSSLVIVITIFFVKFVKFSKSIKMSVKIPEARRSQYNYSFIQNFSLLIFIFLIISGLLGSQESLKNIINVFFCV